MEYMPPFIGRGVRVIQGLRASILSRRSSAYEYARTHVPCTCRLCKCPGAGGRQYSFTLVDEERRTIFHSIPKSGSSMIRSKLGVHGLPQLSTLRNPRFPRARYFTFAIVRNPWARMVSAWRFFVLHPSPTRRAQLASMTTTSLQDFRAFVDFAIRVPNHHWQPQDLFVPDDVDYVGRLESIDATLKVLAENIWRFDPTNVVSNATTQYSHDVEYRHHYDDELRAVVAAFYRRDIERFGYDF